MRRPRFEFWSQVCRLVSALCLLCMFVEVLSDAFVQSKQVCPALMCAGAAADPGAREHLQTDPPASAERQQPRAPGHAPWVRHFSFLHPHSAFAFFCSSPPTSFPLGPTCVLQSFMSDGRVISD